MGAGSQGVCGVDRNGGNEAPSAGDVATGVVTRGAAAGVGIRGLGDGVLTGIANEGVGGVGRGTAVGGAAFVLAGMNAHINHDLCIAVVQTCREMRIEPVHLSAEYRDYTQVNQLLDNLIDSTKRELMVGLLGNALPFIGRVEDLVGAFGILGSREVAWTNSELYWHAQSLPGA